MEDEQRAALSWALEKLPVIEVFLSENKSTERYPILVMDVRLERRNRTEGGVYAKSVEDVLSRAKIFDRAKPGELVTYLEVDLGFERNFAVSCVTTSMRRLATESQAADDAFIYMAVGDLPEPVIGGGADFGAHTLTGMTLSEMVKSRCEVLRRTRFQNSPKDENELKRERVKSCAYCGRRPLSKLKRCSRCGSPYCSPEHQRFHWNVHKKDCGRRRNLIDNMVTRSVESCNDHAGPDFRIEVTKSITKSVRMLSPAGVDAGLETFEAFKRDYADVERDLLNTGIISQAAWSCRYAKTSTPFGDDEVTTREKFDRGERYLIATLDHADYLELAPRVAALTRAGIRRDVAIPISITDDTELRMLGGASLDDLSKLFPELSANSLRKKQRAYHSEYQEYKAQFSKMDPRRSFLFCYTNVSKGPLFTFHRELSYHT